MSDVLAALDRWQSRHSNCEAFRDPAASIDFHTLAGRIAGVSTWLDTLPPRIGLLGASSIDWLIADLAAWHAGKTLVPLPHFFSDAQLRHIVADAGLTVILAAPEQQQRAAALGAEALAIPDRQAGWQVRPMTGHRIVYTSGSTGAPKGVILGAAQIRCSCAALTAAIGATPADRHLSVLPFSLLLEAICGIYLPILVGGTCVIAPEIVAAQGIDVAVQLGTTAERCRPSTTVLVPQLLQAWVMAAAVGQCSIPDSLRFVAVGGAAVPDSLAERAWSLGLPVHEGYGLTECGSVVAVNRPGQRRAGTVGPALPGYTIEIAADGEIVVTSAAVFAGYLNGTGDPPGGRWQTGDLGSIDAAGCLLIAGRKDNLIVTANGRNISPEWIETMLLADLRIGRCVVLPAPDGRLAVLLEASAAGARWLCSADHRRLDGLIATLTAGAPDYAVPRRIAVLPPDALAAADLLTGNGRPRRKAIAAQYHRFFPNSPLETETRHAVL